MEITTTAPVRWNALPSEIIDIIAKFDGRTKLRNGVLMAQIPTTDPRRKIVKSCPPLRINFTPTQRRSFLFTPTDTSLAIKQKGLYTQGLTVSSTLLPKKKRWLRLSNGKRCRYYYYKKNVYKIVEMWLYYKSSCININLLFKCDGTVVQIERLNASSWY